LVLAHQATSKQIELQITLTDVNKSLHQICSVSSTKPLNSYVLVL